MVKLITDREDILFGVRGNTANCKILFVGEYWGSDDRRNNLSFTGKSGKVLNNLILDAGIDIENCAFTSVVNYSAQGNVENLFQPTIEAKKKIDTVKINECYPHDWVRREIVKLYKVIDELNPQVIVALGNLALWALWEGQVPTVSKKGIITPTGIKDYRGSQLWCHGRVRIPLLPTYSPSATFKTYAWRHMLRHDLRARVFQALYDKRTWMEPSQRFVINPSFADVCSILDNLIERKGSIALDLETRNDFIACIGIAWSEVGAICIPLLTTKKGKKDGYWSAFEEHQILQKLRKLFSVSRICGQNLAFDMQYLFHELFILPKITDDTMLKHHTLYPGGGDPLKGIGPQGLVQKSLNHLSSLYCSYHRYWKDEGKTWETNMPEEQLWIYNCRDCCATFEINKVLDKYIASANMTDQYAFQIKQLNNLALPMMLRGVKINKKLREQMTMELLSAIAMFEEKIGKLIPLKIEMELVENRTKNTAAWYKSPKQLATLFYDVLGIKPVFSPTGTRTTGKKALPIIANREPLVRPIVDALTILRSLNIFYGTFITSTLDHDSRMRCSFNVAGTETFRWSSSSNIFGRGTNLQNLPKGDKEGQIEHLKKTRGVVFPNVRKLFIPDSNYLIVDADLSGADAQVVAWESGEEDLKSKLKTGIKIHSEVAIELFGSDEFPHYDMCKRRIHATNYGGSARTLTQILSGLYGGEFTNLDIETAFQEHWFEKYPGIKDWHRRVENSLQRTHGVKNKFGNRIIYQDRLDTVFNQALAWIPQSTVALVCNRGALAIKEKFPFIQLLVQVHDSIVFQMPISEQSNLPDIHQTLNDIEIPYRDPLRISWSCNTSRVSWGDCE